MKLVFTGDFFPVGLRARKPSYFSSFRKATSGYNIVLNLEAPLLLGDYHRRGRRDHMYLRLPPDSIECIRDLNPFLVNLSSNHINDYGNSGAEDTFHLLGKHRISYFGAGYKYENHNQFVDRKNKILFLSYCTHETGALPNLDRRIGPRLFSIEVFQKETKSFKDYTKIVLMHWGRDMSSLPSPEQRTLARQMIDLGADLIVGNHAHVIQGFETYKGKYIFYSLGAMLFPSIEFSSKKKTYRYFTSASTRKSLVPFFSAKNGKIRLDKVVVLKAKKGKIAPSESGIFLCNLFFRYSAFYRLIFSIYLFWWYFHRKLDAVRTLILGFLKTLPEV